MKNKILSFLGSIKYNIFYAILLAIVFIVGEQIFRYIHPLLTFNLNAQSIQEQFLIAFIATLFVNKRTIKWLYGFFLFFTLIQFIHFNYYGTWIFPLEYLLFFTRFNETMETFVTVLDVTIVPIVIVSISTFIIFKTINKLNDRRAKIPYLSYVLILFLIFIPVRVFVDKYSTKGARPNVEVNPVLNTIETLGYLIGNIVPKKISGTSGLEKKIIAIPKVDTKEPDVNVIVIMGESLTIKPMSLYGYKDKTTPYLDKLKSDKNFFYQIAFSSGVMTDVSLPSFFNMLYQPDSTPQIISTNTCLFKMAKLNGFETHFYSAQPRDGLSYIKSYLCTKWIDHYSDGTDFTGGLKKSALDIVLIDSLNNVDLNRSNFIVLHQIGSHSPARIRYPKKFDIFKPDPKDPVDISGYKNSVLYTDFILNKIIETVKKKTKKPTYIFFTSDHGEGIDEHSGHGHLKDPNQFMVPFIMYKINTDKNLDYKLKDSKYTSHFEISKLVANALGYNTGNFRVCNEKYIVCGKDITGVAGYLKVDIRKNKIKKMKLMDK